MRLESSRILSPVFSDLKNAVECCSRLMSKLFEGLSKVIVYLDDIVIFGKSQAEHDSILNDVLRRISNAGLSLNYKKRAFNPTSTTFLRYKVENGKVSPDPSRTDPVLSFKLPDNVRALQRKFLCSL